MSAAQECLQAGKCDQAVEHLTEVLRECPQYAEAFYLRGQAHFELRKYESAAKDYESAFTFNPHAGNGLLLIEAYLANGDYEAADKAAMRFPGENARFFALRGRARLALEKLTEAGSDFELALQLDPKSDQAFFYLGILSLEQHHFAEAEDHLTRSISLHPNHAKAFWLRAMAREKLNLTDAADADRATAKDLDPTFQFAESAMGKNLLRSVADESRQLLIEATGADGSP